MAALALAATSGWAPPAAGAPPELLLIVHGTEFAAYRTPVFLRTLFSTRTVPLRLHVLADGPGHAGFERAVEEHARPLMWPEDHIRALRVDELPLASEYLERVHPLCHQNGYAYLFLKLLAPELLPDVDHLIVLDPDTVVLADVALLWAQFSQFGPGHLLSMAVDQSDRYYHRLQDPADEVYSEGWAGVPHSLGVNGGVILLRAAAARNATALRAAALRAHLPAANATASSRIQMHVNYQGFDMGKRRRRRVPTPEACYEECRRARGCAAFTYVLQQQHKPSEYACFLKQRGFEAGASYSGGTASGIVEK